MPHIPSKKNIIIKKTRHPGSIVEPLLTVELPEVEIVFEVELLFEVETVSVLALKPSTIIYPIDKTKNASIANNGETKIKHSTIGKVYKIKRPNDFFFLGNTGTSTLCSSASEVAKSYPHLRHT